MNALFHHVMDVVVKDGVYYPRRFTAKQTEALSIINEWFGRNSRSAAGMALKGYTTANTVSFSYHGQLHCSSMGGFDFYENGVRVHNIKITEETLETGHVVYEKKKDGEVLLEIVFPRGVELSLWDIDFGDWCPYDASEEKLVLWYGDSITQSTAVTTPSLIFPSLASRLAGMNHVNRGIGSLFFDETVLDEDDPLHPDIVMVELGANDLVKHGPDKKVLIIDGEAEFCTIDDVPMLIDNARAYLEKLKKIYPYAKIKAMTMLWECLEKNESRVEAQHAYRAELEKLIKELDLEYIDGLTLMPNLEMCCIADRIHLSTIGSMAVAQSLAKYLVKWSVFCNENAVSSCV